MKGWNRKVRTTSAMASACRITLIVSPNRPRLFGFVLISCGGRRGLTHGFTHVLFQFWAPVVDVFTAQRKAVARFAAICCRIKRAGSVVSQAPRAASTWAAPRSCTCAWASGYSSVMVRWICASHAGRDQAGEPRRRAAGQLAASAARGHVDHAHVAPEHALADARCRAPWRRPPWRRNAWRRWRPRAARPSALARSTAVKQRRGKRSPKRSSVLLDAADVEEIDAEAEDHAPPFTLAAPALSIARASCA